MIHEPWKFIHGNFYNVLTFLCMFRSIIEVLLYLKCFFFFFSFFTDTENIVRMIGNVSHTYCILFLFHNVLNRLNICILQIISPLFIVKIKYPG